MKMRSTPTKAELHEMLAEAVRNTQPQQVSAQPEPVRDAQPDPKRKGQPRKARRAPTRIGKNKSVRASASRKRKPR